MEKILKFYKPNKLNIIFTIISLIIGMAILFVIFSYGEIVWIRNSFLFNTISRIIAWPLIPLFEFRIEESFYYDFFRIVGIPLFFIYYYTIGCTLSILYGKLTKRT